MHGSLLFPDCLFSPPFGYSDKKKRFNLLGTWSLWSATGRVVKVARSGKEEVKHEVSRIHLE